MSSKGNKSKEYKMIEGEFTIAGSNEIPFIEIKNENVWHPIYKSELTIGNITVRFTKRFIFVHRIMLKLVFGLKIKNIRRKTNER